MNPMTIVLKIAGLIAWLLGAFNTKIPATDRPWKIDLTALGLFLFFLPEVLPH